MKKLSANLGKKLDQSKNELAFEEKIDAAQQKLKRARKPKNFTIAQENSEWIDNLSLELSVKKGKKISSSALVNAILDQVRLSPELVTKLDFTL